MNSLWQSLHKLSRVSNFSIKLLCRIGLPRGVRFCCGSLNVGVSLCSTTAFSLTSDIAIVLWLLSSSFSKPSLFEHSVGENGHQSWRSDEGSVRKSIASGSRTSFLSVANVGLEAPKSQYMLEWPWPVQVSRD